MDISYDAEAKSRWGHTEAFSIAAERTRLYTAKDWVRIKATVRVIYDEF